MEKITQKLLIEQMDRKLDAYASLCAIDRPEKGWLYSIRTALGMSYKQLSNRLRLKTPSSSKKIEQREEEGSITLNTLSEAAQAFDMKLVYGFVSKHGSLQSMIEKRALELAKEIVMQTSHNMVLEDQEPSNERLKIAIQDRKDQIMYDMPRYLWD